jgi:hypothetical protein
MSMGAGAGMKKSMSLFIDKKTVSHGRAWK